MLITSVNIVVVFELFQRLHSIDVMTFLPGVSVIVFLGCDYFGCCYDFVRTVVHTMTI